MNQFKSKKLVIKDFFLICLITILLAVIIWKYFDYKIERLKVSVGQMNTPLNQYKESTMECPLLYILNENPKTKC